MTDNILKAICDVLDANLLTSRYSYETMNCIGYAYNDEIVCIDLYNLRNEIKADCDEGSDGWYRAEDINALATTHWYMPKSQLKDYEDFDSYNLVKLAKDIATQAEMLRACIDTANAKTRLLS